MSSTGRGPRLGGPDDFYETPAWAVERLVERTMRPTVFTEKPAHWFEPTAGDGAIIQAVNKYLGRAQKWTAVECRATAYEQLAQLGADAFIADYLNWSPTPAMVEATEVVITNPPFALAEEVIRRACVQFPHAMKCFLVRLGFLASEKRLSLWASFGAAPSVYVLPNRPSFVPSGKTDSADYCWLVWNAGGGKGEFDVLASTPTSVRRPKKAKRSRA